VSREFEHATPNEIVKWAADRFGDGLVMTSSFEAPALVHLVARTAPGTPVVLLDTGFLFDETLAFAQQLHDRFGFTLEVVRPIESVTVDYRTDVDACCAARKVEPLQRALAGRTAWITGLQRSDSPERAHTPIVSWDPIRQLVKINPIATWTDGDVALYEELWELPTNPLLAQGYGSIGCWPCTRPVAPGEHHRAGRWAGLAKSECGIHAPAGMVSLI
jgi:phosphoadenosine phosphosulfate reductase